MAITVPAVHLRSLKNALQDRFPSIKSSHLSEALASALGFRTHAALLAQLQSYGDDQVHLQIDSDMFLARLQRFGYPGDSEFSFGTLEFRIKPSSSPSEFQANISRLRKLEAAPQGRWPEIYASRRSCAMIFAKAFNIGNLESPDDDKMRAKRFTCGVDYKSCEPGWGGVVNTRHPLVDFPGSSHRVQFYERLPLDDGRYVEYCTAIVSMPYADSDRVKQLPQACALAKRIGWECIQLDEWSWYAPGVTMLMLFRRKSSHAEMTSAWTHSFKRWLMKNQSRLTKGVRGSRRQVTEDAINCQHLPLDVRGYADCRERYLKEFSPYLYYSPNDLMTKAFEKLFEQWHIEQSAALAQ